VRLERGPEGGRRLPAQSASKSSYVAPISTACVTILITVLAALDLLTHG